MRSLSENPMLDLSIFKNRTFSINIIQPFYLQDVLKISPAKTGFIMMAYPIVLCLIAPLSGHLSDKIGSKILTLTGLIITTIGFITMTFLGEKSSMIFIILSISIVALGNGLFQSPNNAQVMSSVPRNKLGIAGSINALIRNLGFVFGVSLSNALV